MRRHLALLTLLAAGIFAALSGASSAQSFDLAALYQAAAPGSTINVPAGVHPTQVLLAAPNKPVGSAPVRIVFAPGASIDGSLRMGDGNNEIKGPNSIILDSPDVKYLYAWNVDKLDALDVKAESFDIFSSRDVNFLTGEAGPCRADGSKSCVNRIAGSERVVIDRFFIHDVTTSNAVNWHVDGLAIFGARDVLIKRSRFVGNEVTNLFIKNCCGNMSSQNITIEANWFASPLNEAKGDAIDISSAVPGLIIRNNSLAENALISVPESQVGTGARIEGNLMMHASCPAGVAYAGNYLIPFSDGNWPPCGPTDQVVSTFGYVDQAALDFRLTPASPVYAQRDIYEQAAPVASQPPPPPPGDYSPACKPTCDEQIADLEDQVASAKAEAASLAAQLSAALQQLEQVQAELAAAQASNDVLRDKLAQINALSQP